MAKSEDDLSPEERKAARDALWAEQKRKKNAKIDSISSLDGHRSLKWIAKNKQARSSNPKDGHQ